jgi:ABC-type arginine/histidine transport system permease subunit
MMEFVLLGLTIIVSILLASALSMVIMFSLLSNEKIIKWYMKWFVKYMKKFEDFDYEALEEEL